MRSDDRLTQLTSVIDRLIEDVTVPRNIRRGAEEAKTRLLTTGDALDVRVASAVSILDELANDPNIPMHGRTLIWQLISGLESLVAR